MEPAPGKIARGVVYDVPPEELEHLDKVEGVHKGYYYRQTVLVVDERGSLLRVETYRTTDPKGPFTPTRKYVGLMVKGAKEHKLDPKYIEELEALLSSLDK